MPNLVVEEDSSGKWITCNKRAHGSRKIKISKIDSTKIACKHGVIAYVNYIEMKFKEYVCV